MKKILLITLLIFISTLSCLKGYSLPQKLPVNELPSDYDHRIDEFASFFYEFIDCQDPNLQTKENLQIVYNFLKNQSLDRLLNIKESLWIFRNKYPDYFEEYCVLNIPYFNTYKNENEYKKFSIFNDKLVKSNWDMKTITIYGFNDCIRETDGYYWEVTKLSPEPFFWNYLVCTINSYEIVSSIEPFVEPFAKLIKFNVNIERQLGFNSVSRFDQLFIISNFNSLINVNQLNELKGKKYLIPIYYQSFFQPGSDILECKTYPVFNLNEIFEVKNSIISAKMELDYKNVISKRDVKSNYLKYFLFKNNQTLSLDDIEKNLLSYLRGNYERY